MSDDQDIGQLKSKLQTQAAQFQSYKQQCKHIEEMLEEQCQKKQSEIKQLKQQAIKKQKGQKMLKAQLSQFEAEVNNLKTQIGDSVKTQSQSATHKEQLDKLGKENVSLKENNTQLEAKLQQLTSRVTQLESQLSEANSKVVTLTKQLSQAQQKVKSPPAQIQHSSPSPGKDSSKAQQQLKKLKEKLTAIQKEKSKLQKALKDKQLQLQKVKHQSQQKHKKQLQQTKPKQKQQKHLKRQPSQPKQLKQSNQHKHQISKLKQTNHHLQQRIKQLQHTDKQQKLKLTNIMNDKTSLLQKYKKLSQQLEREKQKRQFSQHQSPQKTTSNQIMIQDAFSHDHKSAVVRIDALMLTKKHYISPFIEVKDNKLIKIYKSTKNGFEKSLGATRHKLDSVSYDSQALAQTSAEFAKDSFDKGLNHSIVIYGSKRTSKKQIMSSIIQKLKEWLLQKIDQYQQSAQEQDSQGNKFHFMYVKHSIDSQVHEEKESSNREQISQMLDQIISVNSASSPSKKIKKSQKPKVRYLLFSFGDNLRLQIITSSYLNPFIKNNQTFIDYLNTIVFSKLPNILQSANNNYHIITLINPIVSEYEECKNTLSITMVPFGDSSAHDQQPMTSTLAYSPAAINRDDLNDMTKKKLEGFEKETEQAGLRVRKVEEQCNYFRIRFQQLQVRLKNLINTHQQQNTYLKKSPVTLSYQKLLKFVNSVLSRNTPSTRSAITPNLGHSNQDYYQNQVNMYIEEDAKSLDGY